MRFKIYGMELTSDYTLQEKGIATETIQNKIKRQKKKVGKINAQSISASVSYGAISSNLTYV